MRVHVGYERKYRGKAIGTLIETGDFNEDDGIDDQTHSAHSIISTLCVISKRRLTRGSAYNVNYDAELKSIVHVFL